MKSLIILLLSVPLFFAQEKSKGDVSLIFNNKEIRVPVTSIILRKENNIYISIRAEESIDDNQKLIAIELSLNELKADTKEFFLEGTKINIITRGKNIETEGEELLILFSENDSEEDKVQYSVYNNGHKKNFDILYISMKLNIDEVTYNDGLLKINGSFSGKFRSDLTTDPLEYTAEIKDGKFEIII